MNEGTRTIAIRVTCKRCTALTSRARCQAAGGADQALRPDARVANGQADDATEADVDLQCSYPKRSKYQSSTYLGPKVPM